MSSGIYRIRNKINNKQYIGSSQNLRNRWSGSHNHLYNLRRKTHCNSILQNAWNKYGEENFVFEVIIECSISELREMEQYYLDNGPCEYNICKIAYSRRGVKASKETKERNSKASKGSNNPMFGKSHSEEAKRKMSLRKVGPNSYTYGKALPLETRLKLSIANSGINNAMYGLSGDLNPNAKAVIGTCISTGIEKFYPCMLYVEHDGFSKNHVSSCCNGKRKTHKKHYWRFADQNDLTGLTIKQKVS